MSPIIRAAFLTAIWVLLWGDVSLANLASGALLAVALLVLSPTRRSSRRPFAVVVRPVALARLVGYILGQVVVANVLIARQILSRDPNGRSGVVVYEFESSSRRVITFVTTVLAMSPGTMPVHVDDDPALIAVHVLRFDDAETVRRGIRRLERLSVRATSRPGEMDAA